MAIKQEPGLDGLRGVAIAAVVAFHYMPRVVTGGGHGVDVFFVLSGWLITAILLGEADKTGTVDYLAFLRRRFLRLTPALFALLIAYVLLAPVFLPQPAPKRWFDAAMTATYLTNIRETFWPRNNPLSHTWFLALQGQFYLLWPPILVALRKLGRDRAAAVLLVAWVALTIARFVWRDTIGGPGPYYFTPLHATGLLLGAALALRPVRFPGMGVAGWLALALTAGILGFGRSHQYFMYLQPVVEWAALLIVARPPAVLRLWPLRWLGKISYGVYLWHVPFMWVYPPKTWTIRGLLILASLGAGIVSYFAFERPFDRLRKRTPAAAGAPA